LFRDNEKDCVRKSAPNLVAMHTCELCGFVTEEKPRDCPCCRANNYLEFKKNVSPEGFQACKYCHGRTLLNEVGACRRCMRTRGLKVCRRCRELCSVGLTISAKKALCNRCDAEVKREARAKARTAPGRRR
jgi:hypothetical protein